MRNSIIRTRRFGIAIMALVLATLLLFTACAPAVPTQEEKIIEIGTIHSLTGGSATADQPTLLGIQDYIRYFNEEKGIPGVTLENAWTTGMALAETFFASYVNLRDRGVPVIYTHSVWLVGFQWHLEEDKLPIVSNNADEALIYPPSWIYCSSPTWTEQFCYWVDYMMANWKEDRPPRLAIMGWDHAFTRAIVAGGTKYAQSKGVEMLPLEIMPILPLDTTTNLLRLKEEGADFVFLQCLASSTLPVLLDAQRLELLDQIHFAGCSYAVDSSVIEKSGAAGEGFTVPKTHGDFYDKDLPIIQKMLDLQVKYRGKIVNKEQGYVGGGWCQGAIICEALRRAVEKVGAENVDGLAVKEALDTFKDFDADGIRTVTYTPDSHKGYDKAAIYQIKGGTIVRVTDYTTAPTVLPQGQ